MTPFQQMVRAIEAAGFERGNVKNPKTYNIHLGEKYSVGFNMVPGVSFMILWYDTYGVYLGHESQKINGSETWPGILRKRTNHSSYGTTGMASEEDAW